MYDNNGTAFNSAAYDTTPLYDTWAMWTVVGSVATGSTFYINGAQVGNTVAQSAAGNTHNLIAGGGGSQSFGHIATAKLYNRILTLAEIQKEYTATAGRFNLLPLGAPAVSKRETSSGVLQVAGEFDEWTGAPVVDSSLKLWLDVGQPTSYPGTGTTWTDLSGNGNNGTLTNGPTYTSTHGGSLIFDGINDTVIVPHSSSLKPSSQITIAAWVKPTILTSTVYSEIYRKEDGTDRHLFSFQNSGTILSFGMSAGGVYTELDVAINSTEYTGTWNYLVATYDGINKRVYKNANVIGTEPITGSLGSSGTANSFIGSFSGSSEYLNGNIPNLMIYNRALTADEISTNFNALRGRYGI
jgi:hypothetical protein